MQPKSFEHFLAIVCSVLDAYSACLFLSNGSGPSDEDTAYYALEASFSLGDKVSQGAVIERGKGLVGWIARSKEPLLVSNFDQRQNYLGYYRDNEEQNIKAFMGYPLPNGRGVLCVDSKRQYSFSEKDQKILHLLVDFVSQMQEELILYKERELSAKYYAALHNIYKLKYKKNKWNEYLHVFLQILTEATGLSYSVLFTLDASGENFLVEGENATFLLKEGVKNSYPLHSGLAGWVFQHGKPVLTNKENSGAEKYLVGKSLYNPLPQFATVYAYPLAIHRKIRGVLCLAHPEVLELNAATQDFVRMAAEYLTLFLENLYIKNKLKGLQAKI